MIPRQDICRVAAACGLSLALASCRQQTCDIPTEIRHPLDLTRSADRAHLAADLDAAEHVAGTYGDWAAAHLPPGPAHISADTLREHARAYCRAILSERIGAVHGLDPETLDQVHLALAPVADGRDRP